MRVFGRDLLERHCVGDAWPSFCGRVDVSESFRIETVEANPNGPVEVVGVRAGEAVAIHVESIEPEPPYQAPNGGPFVKGMGPPIDITLQDGIFVWPSGFELRAEPSIGNVAVLPAPTADVQRAIRQYEFGGDHLPNSKGWRRIVREPRGKHCHQDCWAIQAGTVVHMRAQVDGVGLCIDDVHGYISHGELAFAAIEGNATVQLRVERSAGWEVDWPLVETAEDILLCCGYANSFVDQPVMHYVDLVREAYRAMRSVVAARAQCSIEQANSIVATAASVYNCALYGLGEGYVPQDEGKLPYDLSIAIGLPKHALAAWGVA